MQLAQDQADREDETRKSFAKGKTVENLLAEFGASDLALRSRRALRGG